MKGKKNGDENLEKASGGYTMRDPGTGYQIRTTFTDEEADKLNKKLGLTGNNKFEGGIEYDRDDIERIGRISSSSETTLRNKLGALGLHQEGETKGFSWF